MTLRELRYLVALADCRHFGRAAADCHVSQPTLSTQLKKLEAFLGVTLFERTNKALHITRVGAEIVARARRVLAEADAIIDVARHTGGPLTGPLSLGIIPTLGPYALPLRFSTVAGERGAPAHRLRARPTSKSGTPAHRRAPRLRARPTSGTSYCTGCRVRRHGPNPGFPAQYPSSRAGTGSANRAALGRESGFAPIRNTPTARPG